MEIIFKEQNGTLFGSTKMLGIGKKQPELIYGKKAKELREKSNITTDDLAKEFDIRPNLLNKIENQRASLDEKTMNKYIDKFGVNKGYFFDLDLETLILSGEGHVLRSFDTSEECKNKYNDLMEQYEKYIYTDNDKKIFYIDFSKKEGNE